IVVEALADDPEVVAGDDVLGIDGERPGERTCRLLQPPEVEEREAEAGVRGRRAWVQLDRTPRGRRALGHRTAPVVAERELEVHAGIRVLERDRPVEGTDRVPDLAEVVVGEPQVVVRARVLGVGLQELEAAVTRALREAGAELALEVDLAEGAPAVLAIV